MPLLSRAQLPLPSPAKPRGHGMMPCRTSSPFLLPLCDPPPCAGAEAVGDGKVLSMHASTQILDQEQNCSKQPSLCFRQARASYPLWGRECGVRGWGWGVSFLSLSRACNFTLFVLCPLLERKGQSRELHRLQVPAEHLWGRKLKLMHKL